VPSFSHAVGGAGEKEIFTIAAFIACVLMEKINLGISSKKWPIAFERGGSARLNITVKVNYYRGQWECSLFW